MKDEMHVYCKLEGYNEEYLRARLKADKKLLKLEKKRNKEKARSGEKCEGLEEAEEPEATEILLASCQ
jgi:hypothetical protein